MLKRLLLGVTLAACAAFASLPALAAEPTMHEIYQAAQEGRYIEAQSMMDKVLAEHPNSAKAHYVQAELMAKQGMVGKADAELRTAERLDPGVGFAKPDAVSKLRAIIAAPRASSGSSLQSTPGAVRSKAAAEGGTPWGLILGGVALVAFIFAATRFMRQRNAAAVMPAAAYGGMGNRFGANPGMAPYGANPGMQPYGAQPVAPAMGGGMGSGIMGGLATGAALGAGMVAGQALMHKFTDGDRPNAGSAPQTGNNWNNEPAPNDMGGNDFGVNDSSSWDDGGGGGGGDAGSDWS